MISNCNIYLFLSPQIIIKKAFSFLHTLCNGNDNASILLGCKGPGEALPEDVRVQALDESHIAPLVGDRPGPPVHHHHAPGEAPA